MGFVPGADGAERRRFVRHFFEMVAAMIVGMAVLGGLVRLACVLTGHEGFLEHVGATAPIMATNMTVGMVLWMRHCGHGWVPIAEMAAAMYVPLAVLLIPFWIGVLPDGAVLGPMHLLMLPAMWFVMARRNGEYVHDHRAHVGEPAHAR